MSKTAEFVLAAAERDAQLSGYPSRVDRFGVRATVKWAWRQRFTYWQGGARLTREQLLARLEEGLRDYA